MRIFICSLVLIVSVSFAQTAPTLRSIPPPGIELSPTERAELGSRLQNLQRATAALAGNPLLPDVLIYQEAVRYALENNEFFKADEVLKAHNLLSHGLERARLLSEGRAPWTTATGLVVRGIRLENRPKHPALWSCDPRQLLTKFAQQVAPRCLVPWPQRDLE